jgi:uncharacterized membrane protein YkvA (DUF1232 family)
LSRFQQLQRWARTLKRDTLALCLVARDPSVPGYAKAVAACVAAYALSPIDLIPNFIPVIGYLDNLILLPFGIALAICLIPPVLLARHRERASAWIAKRPINHIGALLIVIIWLTLASLCVAWLILR